MRQTKPGEVTHGMSNSPEYRIWCHIKERCLDENSGSYLKYGARGVKIEDEWVEDFAAFFRDVGLRPSDGLSVERVDNRKGYVKGNVRWATAKEQGRNRFKRSDNSTGITGVHLECISGRWVYRATWYDPMTDKQIRKSFNVSKHGLLPAMARAAEVRSSALKELREKYGYADSHGEERYKYDK